MTESILSGRRTRSQLVSPDNVLQTLQNYPLNDAKATLQNHSDVRGSQDDSDDEDELLLSPKKKEVWMESSNTSKRSASPPLQDEYFSGPSDGIGRELKRIRRDFLPLANADRDTEHSNAARPLGHTRNLSDPNIAAGRRPSRKRSATTSKKRVSTVSASPASTAFSPVPVSPTKGRAQSVPLFSTAQDMPRIDFRNPPPSPKRKRSRSRSPSKDRELKLRITSSIVAVPPKLPTILAGVAVDVSTSDAESSVLEEAEMPPVPKTTTIDTEMAPPSPSTASRPMLNTIPATPAPNSLNVLIPMSPLTPLPETPLPNASADRENHLGWDIEPMKDLASVSPVTKPPPTVAASASISRLPRLSMAPPPPPPPPQSKLPRPQARGPSITSSKKPVEVGQSSGKSAVGKPDANLGPEPPNAFTFIMQGAHKLKERQDELKMKGKGKVTDTVQGKVTTPRGFTFAPVVGKGMDADTAESSTKPKVKLRERMRKREKPETQKTAPALVALPDEDEEEQREFETSMSQNAFAKIRAAMGVEETIVEPSTLPLPASPTTSTDVFVYTPIETDAIMTHETVALTVEDEPGRVSEEELEVPTSQEDERFHPDILVEDEAGHGLAMGDFDMPPSQGDERALSRITVDNMEDLEIPSSQENERIPPSIVLEDSNGDATDKSTKVVPEVASDIVSEIIEEDAVNKEQPSTPGVAPPPILGVDISESSEEQAEATEIPAAQPTRKSKLPLGKKRQPPSIALPTRVTRSVSNRKNGHEAEGLQQAGPSQKKSTISTNVPVPVKRTASGTLKKSVAPKLLTPVDTATQDISMDTTEDMELNLPPGSPMKTSSPIRASPAKASSAKASPPKASTLKNDEVLTIQYGAGTLSLAKTPIKSRLLSNKPASSPSPSKIARSTAFLSKKPSVPGLTRAFSSSQIQSGPGSSLSTLSNALEKLRMPPPSRPNTSMGFNRDSAADSDDDTLRTKDDVAIGRASLGFGRSDGGVKRSSTVGAGSFKSSATTTASNATASSSKSSASGNGTLIQKPLSMFMTSKGAMAKPKGSAIRGTGKIGTLGSRAAIFGVGGPRRTISKKTSLPVVIGSPVKGGGNADKGLQEEDEDEIEDEDAGGKIFNAIVNGSSATLLLENLLAQGSGKGKEKEKDASSKISHSRRVSMLSRDLSQTLNAPPPPPNPTGRGLMGPPATPPSASRISVRSTSDNNSPSQGSSGATRSSARLAQTAPSALMKIKGGVDGHVSSGKKGASEPAPNPAVEALQILKDCVIFVDVKTDDGDEAGTLFVEMLEGVGARVLAGVGQTCTHIVFKNGLPSTTTRYRLLRDPKPLVVGIGWVVECVEQRKHVDEAEFLVDLEHTNVTGANKRRRSMLPKLFANESSMSGDTEKDVDGDRSVDGSVSSVTVDDGLAPLERARRRKSMMIGIHP